VSEQGLELYNYVYFDGASVSRQDLKLLVERHVRNLATISAAPDDVAAVRRAVRADARTVAASLSQGTLAWSAVLLSLGWMPPRADLDNVLTQVETLAATRAGQALIRNTRDDATRAERFMNVLQRAREVHAGVSRPEELLVRQMSSVRLRTSDARVPHIDDVTCAGSRTIDVVPPLNHNDDEPVDDKLEECFGPGVGTTASQ
jgi:hypothetical protein